MGIYMLLVFNPKAEGVCSECGGVVSGGFSFVDKGSKVPNTLCYDCQDCKKEFTVKKAKVVLRKISKILFSKKYFEVLNSKNIIFKSPVLEYEEAYRLIMCKNIDVDIKY